MDKNEAIITYLLECPIIHDNPLFFNFASEESGNNHVITEKDTKKQTFIDGSELKQYTFTVACYQSVAFNSIIPANHENDKIQKYGDENLQNMAIVQEIMDWIEEQIDNRHYPDFGTDCVIDSMEVLSNDPDLDGVDTSVNPPLARYSIGVQIEYLDNTKRLFS